MRHLITHAWDMKKKHPMKKKGLSHPSTRTTLKRPQRLHSAAQWLKTITFTGKRLVHAYARKYNTDLLCSIRELRVLGVSITTEYEDAVKRALAQRLAIRHQKNLERLRMESGLNDCCDENFSFIAGYTSGGAPYGIPWDETMRLQTEVSDADDCPF